MSSTTTAQDICDQVVKLMDKFELNPSRLAGLTTDGVPSMTGKINGFTNKFLDAIGSPGVVVNHCIIHQENLCTKILGFTDVMKSVVKCVNYIRARGLNHRHFKAFLEELDSDYPDVVYFSAVHWLSRASTLKRFWNMRKEVMTFMVSKHHNVACLTDDDTLNDLAFLTDITQHLSDLNVKLPGKFQLVNKMFEHICYFEKKLQLDRNQVSKTQLTHFPC
ncbi:general transcription factor II-I repeat domain-containing protein 2B-like [Watersipora subatra]|uniref:general transcription factor II-I repeat domain-containing protein 2B-like n=1 Tax=Watersipora subatra TaxID=2589382 RepID=UPI00355C5983